MMGFVNSKRFDGVQLYHKSNQDISYYIRYKDEDNKLKRIKIGDKSKGITEPYCNQKRNEIINAIKLGDDLPLKLKTQQKGILFEEVAQKYLANVKIYSSEQSAKDINSKCKNHLAPLFYGKEIDKIRVENLEQLQQEKIKKLSPKTVNQIIELFGTIFNYGLKKGLCKSVNPAINVKRFKVNNTRERYLTLEDINELFEHLKDDKLLTLFVKLALTTGGRLETILHIQKKDVDLSTGIVTLQDLKNQDTYRGFLNNELVKLIRPIVSKLNANGYVVSLDGSKFTQRQIQSRLKPKLDKLFNQELSSSDRKNRVVIHTLRHTFASHLAINGTPIYTIQKLMNHRDIKQTMRYAKLSPDSGKEFVNALY